jgi:hypothetical protein
MLSYGKSKLQTWIKRLVRFTLIKSLPGASRNAGREMVWNTGTVNEYDVQRAIIPFIGRIRKEYELQQKFHSIFISRRVATKKES